jgi:hypothetical protein
MGMTEGKNSPVDGKITAICQVFRPKNLKVKFAATADYSNILQNSSHF